MPNRERLGFLHWVSAAPSGGNRYDAELLVGLRALGVEVTGVRVCADLDDVASIRSEAAAALTRERRWLVDGIVAGAVPDLIAAAVAAGDSVVVVVHHFAADAPDLSPVARSRAAEQEGAALRAASGALCSSRWAAAEVDRRYGIPGVGVATPGVEPAAVAPGSRDNGVPRLVAVGSLSAVKDQLTLVAALRQVVDVAWNAAFLGGDTVDPVYAAAVRDAVRDAGLDDRVVVGGAVSGDALETQWAAADLLVHTSRSETYGLVVTEALARGIPAVVTEGTGLVEALQAGRRPGDRLAGATTPPGNPPALAAVLGEWLGSAELAARWRAAALAQRDRLPAWSQTAAAALAYLS